MEMIWKFEKFCFKKQPTVGLPINLIKKPVDYLIVFKSHYFKVIKNNLIKLGVNQETIIDINELEKKDFLNKKLFAWWQK